jgi:hypothetical protein
VSRKCNIVVLIKNLGAQEMALLYVFDFLAKTLIFLDLMTLDSHVSDGNLDPDCYCFPYVIIFDQFYT